MNIGKATPVGKKAYEIAYALWRIADNLQIPVIAELLRENALSIVIAAGGRKYKKMQLDLEGLQMVVKFGVDINAIGIGNATTLMREIGNLQDLIAEGIGREVETPDVEIADIFESAKDSAKHPAKEPAKESATKEAKDRQSAILEMIKQMGGCRFSDFQGILPMASERTIRYDLEALVEQGLVQRINVNGRTFIYQLAGTIVPEAHGATLP